MTNNKKKIFITGSSSGIGLHLAKKLSLDKKNEIIINSRNLIKLTKAKKIISDCEYIKGDVSDYKIALKISKKLNSWLTTSWYGQNCNNRSFYDAIWSPRRFLDTRFTLRSGDELYRNYRNNV